MVLRARRGPALIASALLTAAILAGARPAHAWVDVHVEGDDMRLTLDRSGKARVEHRITLKIAGGPLRSLDLRGVDRDAVPEAEGYIVPQKEANQSSLASAVPVTLDPIPPGNKPEADGSAPLPVLRVRFGAEKGIGRGVYVLLVRYGTNLSDRIAADGGMARITWRSPVWEDGLDSARLTFDLPAAPNEPRADDAAVALGAATDAKPMVLSTVRRGTSRDALELLRPYVSKGEAVTWTIHTDLRVVQATSPENARPAPPPPSASTAIAAPAYRALALAGAAALFVIYSLLVAFKAMEVARDARAADVLPRPLIPIPTALRAVLAGLALVAGLGVELVAGKATLGAILVLLATGLAAHLTPRWNHTARLRGPGRWLPVTEADAFRDPPRAPGGLLDVSTRAGKALFLLALAGIAGGVYALNDASPYQASLIAFDATAILAIFCTGRRAELPPRPEAPARFLRDVAKIARRAMKGEEIRVVGRIRVPEGQADPDEIRLALSPRKALTGFTSIEVGVVYLPGAGGPLGIPEVLVRISAGSACQEVIERLARQGKSVRGRKPGEIVFAFSPRLPTARMTAGLAIGLLRAVTAPKPREESVTQPPLERRVA